MAGYQYICIVGNVGRGPEMRYTATGTAVCDFSVAVNRSWNNRETGERVTETDWFRVTAWRGLAETVNEYVVKGMTILVTGRVEAHAYIDKDGEAQATLELTAQDIQFLSRVGDQDSGSGSGSRREREESEVPDWDDF